MRSRSIADSRFSYLVLALAVAGWAVVATMAFTADDPLFLAPFRESQTAITADYLVRQPEAGLLAYQVPVLGAPWQLPFEFPLFQHLTAAASRTGLSIAQAGRIVNLLGFMACLAVLSALWGAWPGPDRWLPVALAFALATPIHSVYATSHMMESWALLLGLLQVLLVVRYLQAPRMAHLVLAGAAGAGAAVVKITTWLPCAALATLLGAVELYRAWGAGAIRERTTRWSGPLVVAAAGFAAGIAWSAWSSEVRSANALAHAAQDVDALFGWVFGSIADRFSITNWVLLAGKHMLMLFGPIGPLVPLLFLVTCRRVTRAHPLFPRMLVLIGAYLVHAVVFMRLHLRHDYYLFGAGLFLILAVTYALLILSDTGTVNWRRFAVPALLASMITGGVVYTGLKRGYRDLAVDAATHAVTTTVERPGALLMFGFDWSPRLPFATDRKALMVTGTAPSLRALPEALQDNAETPFAAAVVLRREFDDLAAASAREVGLDPDRRSYFWSNGYLLLPPGAPISGDSVALHPIARDLMRRVPRDRTLPNGLVYLRLPFSDAEGDLVEVVAKRGTNAFFLRSGGLQLLRIRGYFR